MPRSRKRRATNRRRRARDDGGASSLDRFGFPKGFGFRQFEHPLARINHDDPDRGLAVLAESAERAIQESVAELERLLINTNPFSALADLALYSLLAHGGDEQNARDAPGILQHHVELIQAMALRIEPSDLLMLPCAPDVCELLHVAAQRIFEAYPLRRADWMAEPSQTKEELKRRWVQHAIRNDTAILRNWGYAAQVFRTLRRLFEPIDSEIHSRKGFRIGGLLSMFDKITELRADLLPDTVARVQRIGTTTSVRDAIDAYHSVAPMARRHDDALHQSGVELSAFQNALMTEAMASLHIQLYTFTLDDFASAYGDIEPVVMQRIVNAWSLQLGDLANTPVDHLFLDNPIWRKPIIRRGDKYFWSLLGLFHSFPLEMCVPLFSDDADLLRLYERRRADFTEEETTRLFKAAFPGATVVQNSVWSDDSGVEYRERRLGRCWPACRGC